MGAKMLKAYFAGKIAKNDWRHALVPRLRNHAWGDGDLDCGKFNYVGPFFVSCDHGCYHSPESHGAYRDGCFDDGHNKPQTWKHVVDSCLHGVSSCDIVFAYIESLECVGTFTEIGYAVAKGIPVVMCVACGLDPRELRFPAFMPGVELHIEVTRSRLKKIFKQALPKYSARSRRRP